MANKEAIRETREAIVVCLTPDVCKTPMGNSMVPVPYQIIAKFDTAVQTAAKVKLTGQPAFHLGSYLPTVIGDEAGVGGGLKCGHNKGTCYPQRQSNNVRVQGHWLVRHGDLFEMNSGSPYNTLGMVHLLFASPRKGAGPQSLKEEYELEEKRKLKPEERTVKKTTSKVDGAETTIYTKEFPNGAVISEVYNPDGSVLYMTPYDTPGTSSAISSSKPAWWPNPSGEPPAPPPTPNPMDKSPNPVIKKVDELCEWVDRVNKAAKWLPDGFPGKPKLDKLLGKLNPVCEAKDKIKETAQEVKDINACQTEAEKSCEKDFRPPRDDGFWSDPKWNDRGVCITRRIRCCELESIRRQFGDDAAKAAKDLDEFWADEYWPLTQRNYEGCELPSP